MVTEEKMPKPEITRESVLKAIDEFDKLGEDLFLSRYGFHRAKRLYIQLNRNLYSSKAIYGVACKFLAPEFRALRASEFNGGDPVVKPLRRLGFQVVEK
jgi:5-methylcytosine-specific restriction enzyme A